MATIHHLADGGPCPWAWTLALDCMDIQGGSFVQWPYRSDWSRNSHLLTLIRAARRAWLFQQARPEKWTDNDIAYYEWLTAE